MKTKKLVAFLVGAILLCTCIAGTLIFTASAATETYVVGTTPGCGTLKDALATAKNATWQEGSSLEIQFSGSVTLTEGNLLFGQTTIFLADGTTKLPITINGGGTGSITLPTGKVAAANDYTFKNLTIVTTSGSSFFAGSGEVVFEEVTFEGTNTSFFGDNFTQDAYVGWENRWQKLQEAEEYVASSITFGKGTSYKNGTNKRICVVGYYDSPFAKLDPTKDINNQLSAAITSASNVTFETLSLAGATAPDIRPINTTAKIVIDSKTTIDPNNLPTNASADFDRLFNRYNYSPVAESIIEIKSGSIRGIAGDVHNDTAKAYVGDLVFKITGGFFADATGIPLRALSNTTLYGDLKLDFGQENANHPASVNWIQLTNKAALVTGDVDVKITGGEIRHATSQGLFGVGALGTSTYDISNMKIATVVPLNNNPGVPCGSIVTKFTNSEIAYHYAITNIDATIQSISTEIKDSKFAEHFYGVTKDKTVTVKGDVSITVSGKTTFSKTYFGLGNAANVTVNGNVSHDISGEVSIGSNFFGVCGSSGTYAVKGNVTNTLSGASSSKPAKFPLAIYASSNKGVSVIDGKLTNILVNCSVADGGQGCFFAGGEGATIKGGVENTFEDSTFEKYVYSGGTSSVEISNTKGTVALKNTVLGNCVFHGFFAGSNSDSAKIVGDIVNEIRGGTFGCYGNSYSSAPIGFVGAVRNYLDGAFTGNVTTTIYGGTFNCNVIAGISPMVEITEQCADLENTVTLNLYGGTFNKKIYTNCRVVENGPMFATAILNVDPTQSTTALKILDEVIETSATTVNVTGGETVQIGKETTLVADTVTGASLTLEQAEEWIAKKVYFSHSANNATTLTAQTASGVPGKYEIVTEGGQQILRGSGTALTAARLVINSRVGLLAYVPKAEVAAFGDTFTVSFKLGSTELASYTAAQIKALDTETVQGVECYAIPVSGVGPTNFANAISYSGIGLAPGETTIHELAQWGAENWESDADKNLAKAIVNLGEVVTEVAEPTYSGLTKYTGSMVAPSREGTTVSSYALHLSDTIALKLKLSDVENLGVKVGDVDLVADETYLYDAQNSSLYVFINLARINEEVTVTILDGGVAEGSFTASISGVANAYSENAIADAILVLAQAVSQIPTSAN